MASFIALARAQYTRLPETASIEECSGKTYIVTGANVGLGYECAKRFVQLMAGRVILGVRSVSKGEVAKASIEADTGRTGVVEVWPLDLSSHQSVKNFADKVNALKRVDALVQNAAVAMMDYEVAEGLEMTLTVNVISTMLLATLVQPKLQACAEELGFTPHIAIVGSGAAFGAAGNLEKFDAEKDILEQVNRSEMKLDRYPVSKLLLLYAVREYAAQHPVSRTNVVINYVNPGLNWTKLNRHAPLGFQIFLFILRLLLAWSPKKGSLTELHGAVSGYEGHGKYLSGCKVNEGLIPDWVTNESGKNLQKRLWNSVAGHLNKIQPGCV